LEPSVSCGDDFVWVGAPCEGLPTEATLGHVLVSKSKGAVAADAAA